MRRRQFITLLGGAAAAWPVVAQSQTSLSRVGALIGYTENDPVTQRRVGAFVKGLADHGWVQGRNLVIDFRYGGADIEKNRVLARELINLQPQVILANTTSVTAAVQRESKTVPVVFVIVSDPIGSGFVSSLPRPGGNITGFVNVEDSMGGKWIELLHEVAPQSRRAIFMVNPTTGSYYNYYLRSFESAASTFNMTTTVVKVGNAADIEQMFTTLKSDDGVIVMPDGFMTVNRGVINAIAVQHRVPVVSGFSQSGSLVSYAPNSEDLFLRSASYVDRILRGAAPAELPVQLPVKFELAVNLQAAKALGITIPPTLIARADEVIE